MEIRQNKLKKVLIFCRELIMRDSVMVVWDDDVARWQMEDKKLNKQALN